MPETPDQKARNEIDAKLAASGWLVQDRDDLNRKAVGAVEAKANGTHTGVEAQSAKYAARLPDNVLAHPGRTPSGRKPMPRNFLYGGETLRARVRGGSAEKG